jgi:hypothetical protein
MKDSQFPTNSNSNTNSAIEADIKMSRDEYQKKYYSDLDISRDEKTYKEIRENLDLIAQKKLEQWRNQLEKQQKNLGQNLGQNMEQDPKQNKLNGGKNLLTKHDHQSSRLNESSLPLNWHKAMRTNFANHLNQNSHIPADLEMKAGKAYIKETPSANPLSDGERNFGEMPVRRIDFDSVPSKTRLV